MVMPNKSYKLYGNGVLLTFEFSNKTFNVIAPIGAKALITYYVKETDNIKYIYGKINGLNLTEAEGNDKLIFDCNDISIPFSDILSIDIIEIRDNGESFDISEPGTNNITLKDLMLFDMQNLYVATNAEDAFKEIAMRLNGYTPELPGLINDNDLESTITTLSASEIISQISTKFSELIGSSPEFLNTIYELANAIGNDPNFSLTILNIIAGKVSKIDGMGLSTNDYKNEDKAKVNIIKTDGNGLEVLCNDGKYKTTLSINDADLTSTITTLSAYMISSLINSKLAEIVGSSPELLDTIEELANALNNDSNFATTITNMINSKVSKIDGMGLSKNNYNDFDKAKVDMLINNGDGSKVLYDDGSYRLPTSGEGGDGTKIDDNNLESTNTTLSASKIMNEISTNISKIIGSSPELLDTIEELAKALNNDPSFAATVLKELTNKVDKVENMGLSSNDYTSADKSKVDIITTNGDGSKVLYDDGSYKLPPSGGESGGETGGGASTWNELTNKPFDEIDSTTLFVDNKKLSAKRMILTKLQFDLIRANNQIDPDMIYIITDDNSSEEINSKPSGLIQKTFLNKTANDSMYINIDELSLDEAIIQLYKFIPGEENIVQTLKTFNNSESDSFFYNTDCVEFDGSMRIKDSYELDFNINADGVYETDVIDRNSFIDLVYMEVV